jgi:hypothetical protein
MQEISPLTLTVPQACRLSGFGPTSIWKFIRDGQVDAVRVPGTRRTLISYHSLAKLLTPSSTSAPPTRRRGRSRKLPASEARG